VHRPARTANLLLDPHPLAGGSGIDTLILLDRAVDMVTPMATQLTYEGLLDEVFGLSCGQARTEQEGGRAPAASLVPRGAGEGASQTCIGGSGAAGIAGWAAESHAKLARPTPAVCQAMTCQRRPYQHSRFPPHAGPGRKVYGLNSADAVFKETRDRFYIGARKWLNETLRQAGQGERPICTTGFLGRVGPGRARKMSND
jgi:hypothetical protein